MTLKASLYDQLTREELIRLLEARDNEPDNAEIYISSETVSYTHLTLPTT